MQNKKILTLPALVIISLLVSGVGFSHWEKIVTINGTVQTGYLCAKFSLPISQDDIGKDWTIAENMDYDSIRQLDKDVGSCSITIDPENNMVLDVSLDNVYPSYFTEFHYRLSNCGTIPWRIQEVIFNPGNVVITHNAMISLDLNGDNKDDVQIDWGNNFLAQVDKGGTLDMSFGIHVTENAPQGQTLYFTAQIVVWNWNENLEIV